MAIKIQGTTVIDDSKNINNIASANVATLSLSGTQITATAAELNTLDGLTGSVQTQLDTLLPSGATLTKSFSNNESVIISLDSNISTAPVVFVSREIPQANISTKSTWDVTSNASNYDFYDSSYSVDLTPSSANSDGTFTLSSGSFANTDVGKIIIGNGGQAVLISSNGAYNIVTEFNNANTISSGDWVMNSLVANSAVGIKLSSVPNETGLTAVNTLDIFSDGSAVSTLTFENDPIQDLNSNNNVQGVLNLSGTHKFGTQSLSIPDGNNVIHAAVYDLDLSLNDGSYTLSAWFNITNLREPGINPILLMTSADGTHAHGSITVSGRQFGKGRANSTQLLSGYESGVNVVQNTWYHGVATYDSTVNEYKMYLDKTLVLSNTNPTLIDVKPTVTNDVNILVGQEPDNFDPFGDFDGNQCLAGFVDQVRIFNRALSAEEISFLYDETIIELIKPTNQYSIAITNASGQINSEYWTDINSMIADENLNGGSAFYAVSTDNKTTWSIARTSDGTRPIVRNNSGTWEYNSNTTYGDTTWTSASTNEEIPALEEALSIEANRMSGSQLQNVTDDGYFSLGDTLDLMIALYVDSVGIPSSDGVTINYDANALNQVAVPGTHYDYSIYTANTIQFTALEANNFKVRVL